MTMLVLFLFGLLFASSGHPVIATIFFLWCLFDLLATIMYSNQ